MMSEFFEEIQQISSATNQLFGAGNKQLVCKLENECEALKNNLETLKGIGSDLDNLLQGSNAELEKIIELHAIRDASIQGNVEPLKDRMQLLHKFFTVIQEASDPEFPFKTIYESRLALVQGVLDSLKPIKVTAEKLVKEFNSISNLEEECNKLMQEESTLRASTS